MCAVLLNHDFVVGMAHRSAADLRPIAVGLLDSQRRLAGAPLHVHPDLGGLATGAGSFVQWANRARGEKDTDVRSLAEALLRLCSGPFVTDLPIGAGMTPLLEDPPVPLAPSWRREAVLHLANHALATEAGPCCALSYDPTSTLSELVYRFTRGTDEAVIENFRGHAALSAHLDRAESQGLRGTLAVLDAVAARPGRPLVVLDRARDSARHWELDCSEATLWRALTGLENYAAALDEGSPRELAAKRYYEATSIEMSQESGEVWRSPTCRKKREIDVPGAGKQYFDMHSKPGGRTRIHVWAQKVGAHHVIYIGHCGEHLLLPGGKR